MLGQHLIYATGTAPDVVTDGSAIAWDSPSTPLTVISATAGALTVENLAFYPDRGPDSSGAGYEAIRTTVLTVLKGVWTFGTLGSGNVTTGIHAMGCPGCIIENCNLAAWTQAAWMDGGQLMTIRDSVLVTVTGTGSASIRMDNVAQTLRIRSSQTQGGDRGCS